MDKLTKMQFKEWLAQEFINARPSHNGEDMGSVWYAIEDEGTLETIGVECATDYISQDFVFKCSDGFLASGFELGIEQETIWFFSEGRVENNMRDYTPKEVDHAGCRMEAAGALMLDLLKN